MHVLYIITVSYVSKCKCILAVLYLDLYNKQVYVRLWWMELTYCISYTAKVVVLYDVLFSIVIPVDVAIVPVSMHVVVVVMMMAVICN